MPSDRYRRAPGLAVMKVPSQAQHCQNAPTENSDNAGETIIESRVLGLRAEADDDDDGVHGGRMKPLSSFDANKSVKKLARMTNAVKGKQSSLRVSKENIYVETKAASSFPQKGIKRKRSSAGEASLDGFEKNFGKLPESRETCVGASRYCDSSNATKCEEEYRLPPFVEVSMPLSTYEKGSTCGSEKKVFEKLCPSTSLSTNEQFTSPAVNALLNLSSSQEAVVSSDFIFSGVSALPLFKDPSLMESLEMTVAKSNCMGLYILGAAACLSLVPDNSPHEPSVCTAHHVNSSKEVDTLQTANFGGNTPFPMLREMPLDTISKFSRQSTEDSLDSSLNDNGDVSMQEVTQSEVGNQGTYPLHKNFHVLVGRENPENIEKDELPTLCRMLKNPCREAVQRNLYNKIQQETVRDSRYFSNISVPLERKLLVPKIKKHAGRLPIQLKRRKNEILKQKTNIGKKEQIRKFAKSAAPSGLLADLNPGIINHVRNSKQVHAIIEAVVGSATLNALQDQQENQREVKDDPKDIVGKKGLQGKTCENGDSSGNIPNVQNDSNMLHASNDMPGELKKQKTEKRPSAMNVCSSCPVMVDGERRAIDADLLGEGFDNTTTSSSLPIRAGCSSGGFLLEQMACNHDWQEANNHGCHVNERLDMQSTYSASATLKATSVASMWLGLLNQDIKGRLAALRRSRKRVRTIMGDMLACNSIQHLISIGDKHEKQILEASNIAQHLNVLANVEHDIHMDKWRALFDQIDNSLQVEGMQLEVWLKQVKEMEGRYICGLEKIQPCI